MKVVVELVKAILEKCLSTRRIFEVHQDEFNIGDSPKSLSIEELVEKRKPAIDRLASAVKALTVDISNFIAILQIAGTFERYPHHPYIRYEHPNEALESNAQYGTILFKKCIGIIDRVHDLCKRYLHALAPKPQEEGSHVPEFIESDLWGFFAENCNLQDTFNELVCSHGLFDLAEPSTAEPGNLQLLKFDLNNALIKVGK